MPSSTAARRGDDRRAQREAGPKGARARAVTSMPLASLRPPDDRPPRPPLPRHGPQQRRSNDRLLEACEALSAAEFAAPRTGFFPSLRRTLNHVFAVDVYYLDALEETGRGLAVFEPAPDFAEPARACAPPRPPPTAG